MDKPKRKPKVLSSITILMTSAVLILALLVLVAGLTLNASAAAQDHLILGFLPLIFGEGEGPALTVTLTPTTTVTPSETPTPKPPVLGEYIVIGWNDLGMHCYNPDFQDLAVLPPYNTLWAQVIQRGDPPVIVTEGITMTYSFSENTYSVGKSNFWDYDEQLFGVNLPPNIGLTGKGLAGDMDAMADYFIAEGIPLTEFNDGDHITSVPYQLADIVVHDAEGTELARNQAVAPVSTEMHCEYCHSDGGVEDISTGRVETNILTLHDMENQEDYPDEFAGPLMGQRPVLCANCHESNALGMKGEPGIPSLSKAVHKKHAGKVPDSTEGCYNCHPGPETKCLRDVMSTEYEMGCTDCHGGMEAVSKNSKPWLNEPRCDDCHTEPGYEQDNPLFRLSKGHGGIYCEACHDSTHAIATSSEARDAIKFINLQGYAGTLEKCTVCHLTDPGFESPHEVSTNE
jgi:hypothetical protein